MRSSPSSVPVLVIDDDAQMLRTIADILQLHGYVATTATGGSEAMATATAMHPQASVALVDLSLPDIDGIELIGKLRELPPLTEVVILTGNASVDTAIRAMREDSTDYLIKPVEPDRLLATLERA